MTCVNCRRVGMQADARYVHWRIGSIDIIFRRSTGPSMLARFDTHLLHHQCLIIHAWRCAHALMGFGTRIAGSGRDMLRS